MYRFGSTLCLCTLKSIINVTQQAIYRCPFPLTLQSMAGAPVVAGVEATIGVALLIEEAEAGTMNEGESIICSMWGIT